MPRRHPDAAAPRAARDAQDLPEPRLRQYAFGEARGERVEVGHRSSKDGNGADREADVAVGVLGVEEPRVQHCQLLHKAMVWHLQAPREGHRSLD